EERPAPRRPRRGDSRGFRSPHGPRHLSVMLVREAMVIEPGTLDAEASAQEAGRLLAKPDVRAVFVCTDHRLVGVVTRKTLVREVVAPGRDPRSTPLGEIAEKPHYTIDAQSPAAGAFRFLEEKDADGGR